MGKKDKFFGAVVETAEVKELHLDKDVLAEALSADDEVELGASLVVDDTGEVLAETGLTFEEPLVVEYPSTALSYYRHPVTQRYHLISIGFNGETGEVGPVVNLNDTVAMDRSSIEEEFKIAVVRNVFTN